MNDFKTKIGLEIHVRLATKSKMFCRCDNDSENAKPNTNVCPICLGMPGTLPVANRQAIELTIKTGLALDSAINKESKFDRKHYFYPDLPKGYQISQYDMPIASGGWLTIQNPKLKTKKIRLNRIHLEEDAGKLIHKGSDSLVDLNRAGTPLMEIVTEPDIESPAEAEELLKKLANIVKNVAAVSEASMEKGHLRCDANISIQVKTNNQKPKMSEIVEIKNINSFRFVRKALEFEEKRLREEYPNWPEKKRKITRGFDSNKGVTYEQRSKEEAADYRYFPEPDVPPISPAEFDLDKLKNQFGESDDNKIEHLIALGVSKQDADQLILSKDKYNLFEKLISSGEHQKIATTVAKVIVHNYFGDINIDQLEPSADVCYLIEALDSGKIQKYQFQEFLKQIANGKSYNQISDQISEGEVVDVDAIISEIILKNKDEALRYKNGDKKLIGFFMGQIMRESRGNINPRDAQELLINKLNK